MHYALGFSLGDSLYSRDWLSVGVVGLLIVVLGASAPVRAVA